MALCWKWSGPAFLLLVLYAVTAQEVSTPAPTENTENTNGTANYSTHAETTSQAQSTKHTIPSTVSHNTTMNIESIMSQRDHLQAESDRLRVAVIILGIFFALAALFIIIVGIYVFLKRRRFKTLKSENQAQQTTSLEQKSKRRLPHLPKSQNKGKTANQKAKNKADKPVQQQQKAVTNPHSTSTSRTSGDYEEQSNSPDATLPKRSPVAPKTNKEFYANTKPTQDQSNDSAELDEREVYIELDEDKTKTNESDASKPPTASRSDQQIPSEEIYENYTPKSAETYSELDAETQYDHHYD